MEAARLAPVNGMDETGWKVGGRLQWLHVAVSAQVTLYAILPGRGYEQAVMILGAEYDGFLIHDGWAPDYRFQFAFPQSCLAHLRKRCRERMQIVSRRRPSFRDPGSICWRRVWSGATATSKAKSPRAD